MRHKRGCAKIPTLLNALLPLLGGVRLFAIVAAAAWTIHTATAAVAEEGPPRLRVARRDATTVIGEFGALRADTLLLNDPERGAQSAIAFRTIQTLERSRGIQGHSLEAAGIGLGAGVLVGTLLGSYLQPREGSGAEVSFAARGAILVGGAGAAIGALIGAGWKWEDWQRMRVEELHVLMGLRAPGLVEVVLEKRF